MLLGPGRLQTPGRGYRRDSQPVPQALRPCPPLTSSPPCPIQQAQTSCDLAEALQLPELVLFVFNYKMGLVSLCLGQGSCWDGTR